MHHIHRSEPNLLCLELFIESFCPKCTRITLTQDSRWTNDNKIFHLFMITYILRDCEEAFIETVSDWFSFLITNYSYCLHQKDDQNQLNQLTFASFYSLRLNSLYFDFIIPGSFPRISLTYSMNVVYVSCKRWNMMILPKQKRHVIFHLYALHSLFNAHEMWAK